MKWLILMVTMISASAVWAGKPASERIVGGAFTQSITCSSPSFGQNIPVALTVNNISSSGGVGQTFLLSVTYNLGPSQDRSANGRCNTTVSNGESSCHLDVDQNDNSITISQSGDQLSMETAESFGAGDGTGAIAQDVQTLSCELPCVLKNYFETGRLTGTSQGSNVTDHCLAAP